MVNTAVTNLQIIVFHGRYKDRRTKDFTLTYSDGAGRSLEEVIVKNGYYQKTISEEFKTWQLYQMTA
jgi:hypothetical protein